MKFTKLSIAALVMPEGKTDHLEWDGELPAFGVRLRASGSKNWFIQYRINGRQRRESLGDVRKIGLTEARRIARQRFAKIELGIDPAEEREQATQAVWASQALKLRAVTGRYLDYKRDRLRPRSFKSVAYRLNQFKPLHEHPLDMIKRADVAAQLQEISKRSGRMSAGDARGTLAGLFSWAIREGLTESNPVVGTNDPAEDRKARDRVLNNDEIRILWRACTDDSFGRAVKLMLLTGCRRDEISDLQWSEINLDSGVLTILGTRTKNHRTLSLTLPEPALDLLRLQPRRRDDYVFVSMRGRPVTGSWTHWTKTINAKIAASEGKPLEAWVLHDLRRTMRTNLGRLNVQPHIAEAVINHAKGSNEAVYNLHNYPNEVAQVLAMWAEHLLAIVENRESKIAPFPIRMPLPMRG